MVRFLDNLNRQTGAKMSRKNVGTRDALSLLENPAPLKRRRKGGQPGNQNAAARTSVTDTRRTAKVTTACQAGELP